MAFFEVFIEEFRLVSVVDVVGWVRDHEVCLFSVHQTIHILRNGAVPAHQAVSSKDPHVSSLRPRLLDLFICLFGVEVVVIRLGVLLEADVELLDLVLFEARGLKVHAVQVEILEEVLQELLVPLACDLVEGDIQGLLVVLIEIHDDDGDLFISEIPKDRKALVASDDGPVLVDDDRVGISEGFDASLYVLVFGVPWLQLFPGVIFRWLELRNGP